MVALTAMTVVDEATALLSPYPQRPKGSGTATETRWGGRFWRGQAQGEWEILPEPVGAVRLRVFNDHAVAVDLIDPNRCDLIGR